MKRFFEEPKLCLEQFSVIDQTMATSGWFPEEGEDETKPIFPIGNGKPIG